MKKLLIALFVGLLLAGQASAFFSFLEKRGVGEPDNMVFYSDGMGGVLNAKTHIPEYPVSTEVGVVFFHGDNPGKNPNKTVIGSSIGYGDNTLSFGLDDYHTVSFTRPDFCSESGCSSYINGFTDWRSHKWPQINSMCGAIHSYIEARALSEVVVVGASGGAWAAFSVAAFCGERVRGSVLFALPCNHDMLARHHGFMRPQGLVSPHEISWRVESPVALIMGKSDAITPHTHCEGVAKKTAARMDLLKDVGHNINERVAKKIGRRIKKVINKGRF